MLFCQLLCIFALCLKKRERSGWLRWFSKSSSLFLLTASLLLLPLFPNSRVLAVESKAATSVLRAYSGAYVVFSNLFYPGEEKVDFPRSAVAIYFTGLNCPPCEVALPQFLKIVRPLTDGNQSKFKYFLISIDSLSVSTDLKSYLDGKGVDADKEVLLDPYKLAAKQFGVNGIPRTFVISPEGLIVADIEGAVADYKEQLSEGIMTALGEARENE